MTIHDLSYQRPYPDSIEEHIRREEQLERRAEALGRHRRQQFELFELEGETPCPNCGTVGYEPVLGVSQDASVGYYEEEQGCVACIDKFGRTK